MEKVKECEAMCEVCGFVRCEMRKTLGIDDELTTYLNCPSPGLTRVKFLTLSLSIVILFLIVLLFFMVVFCIRYRHKEAAMRSADRRSTIMFDHQTTIHPVPLSIGETEEQFSGTIKVEGLVPIDEKVVVTPPSKAQEDLQSRTQEGKKNIKNSVESISGEQGQPRNLTRRKSVLLRASIATASALKESRNCCKKILQTNVKDYNIPVGDATGCVVSFLGIAISAALIYFIIDYVMYKKKRTNVFIILNLKKFRSTFIAFLFFNLFRMIMFK